MQLTARDWEASLVALPIFPLPSGVVLPYELLPLHVFEPRYRTMIADILKDGRPLAIAELSDGWEADYGGRPPVEPVCGVTRVVAHERLPDGRFHIVVRGVGRVRIEGELAPDKPYREVRARRLEDVYPDGGVSLLEPVSGSLLRRLFDLCAARPGPEIASLVQMAAQATSRGMLADIVNAGLLTEIDLRRRALLALEVAERLHIARDVVTELLGKGVVAASPKFLH